MVILVDRLQNHFQLIIQLVLAAVEGGFVIENSFQAHCTDGAWNDWTEEHQFVELDAEIESRAKTQKSSYRYPIPKASRMPKVIRS